MRRLTEPPLKNGQGDARGRSTARRQNRCPNSGLRRRAGNSQGPGARINGTWTAKFASREAREYDDHDSRPRPTFPLDSANPATTSPTCNALHGRGGHPSPNAETRYTHRARRRRDVHVTRHAAATMRRSASRESSQGVRTRQAIIPDLTCGTIALRVDPDRPTPSDE